MNALRELKELRSRDFAVPDSSSPQAPATHPASPALHETPQVQQPAENFDAFLDLPNRPQAATMSRLPQLLELLQRRRRAASALESEPRPLVQVETEIAEALPEQRQKKLAVAMSEVSKLMPAEQQYWSAMNSTRPDFMLCMARSEKLIDDLNAAIRPVAQHNKRLVERLGQTLKWRSNTFVDIPSLDSLFQELRLELEEQMHSRPETTEAAVQTEAGDGCEEICILSLEAEILEIGRSWCEQAASEELPRDTSNRCRELALLLWPVKDRLPKKTAKHLGRPWQDSNRLSPVLDFNEHHQVVIHLLQELDHRADRAASRLEWTEAHTWRELEFLRRLGFLALEFELDASDRAETMTAMERLHELPQSCKGDRRLAQIKLGCIDFVTFVVLAIAKFVLPDAAPATS